MVLPVLLALFLPAAAADDSVLEVLTVRNRPAADLVAVLQPLAGPEGFVTASADRLIVRASPAALAQIRQLLKELDVPPRALWISVRQGLERTSAASGSQVTTTVTAAGGRSRTLVTGAFAGSGSQETRADLQRLQVLEGRPAFIKVGVAVPVAQGLAYQEADTGFYVVPRLSGDLVTLEISTRRDALTTSGAMDVQRVETTVSGRLGEWLSLGSIARSQAARATDLAGGASRQESEDRSIFVKVEEAR